MGNWKTRVAGFAPECKKKPLEMFLLKSQWGIFAISILHLVLKLGLHRQDTVSRDTKQHFWRYKFTCKYCIAWYLFPFFCIFLRNQTKYKTVQKRNMKQSPWTQVQTKHIVRDNCTYANREIWKDKIHLEHFSLTYFKFNFWK